MQLRTLAGLERKKIEDELAELLKTIAELELILSDEKESLQLSKMNSKNYVNNLLMSAEPR